MNRLLDADGLVALFRAPWDDGRWPSNNMDRVKFLRALLDQHTETWVPRCAATGRPNGVELVTGPPGLTSDLVDLHDRWVEYLDQQGVLDFATVQERFHQRQDRILERVAHVFVDEFQDTNPIQLAIHTRWLQRPGTRLTVVGDDDQSIYRFRGSDIGCFIDLEKICTDQGVAYRQEVLEENWRSTRNIVGLSEAFRRSSVLGAVGMPKTLRPAPTAAAGVPVRLLIGEWPSLAAVVAAELKAEGVDLGQAVEDKVGSSLDAAILLFSTSEKSSRNRTGPAADLRQALEARGLRVYNPRNKTAGRLGSPVHDLLALVSYLIDPVRKAPVNGRMVEVNATHRDQDRWASAEAAPPPYRISDAHATFQKQFRKSEGGNLDIPSPAHADLLAYVDNIRTKLVNASKLRLTLSGFVARLLSFRRFRNSGYTPQLFRQALFTALLEANIAPSRRTRSSLDEPMQPLRTASGQIEWPKQFWQLLDVFGGLLHSTDLDDEDVEAFSDNAVAMLTFHQAKGLEFDHVYVGCTGRDVTPDTALRTALFSGQTPRYSVADGHASTRHRATLQLAQADREREVYVALTRAKSALTFLAAPGDSRPFMSLNPAIAALFDPLRARPHPGDPQVAVKAFTARPGA